MHIYLSNTPQWIDTFNQVHPKRLVEQGIYKDEGDRMLM